MALPRLFLWCLSAISVLGGCSSSDENSSSNGGNAATGGSRALQGGSESTSESGGATNAHGGNSAASGGLGTGGLGTGGLGTGGVSGGAGATSSASSLPADSKVLFLHHSTGQVIWQNGEVAKLVGEYNSQHQKSYLLQEQAFPKDSPYGWNNYPYDYWNIWVKHAGSIAYLEEPTLEMLASQYQIVIWKHCFPVSGVGGESGTPDVTSSAKTIGNYQLQYQALKQKMHEFAGTRFLLWTGAALREADTNQADATRAQTFFQWVKNEWDEPGDNIFIWDFRELETEGGLYLTTTNASGDSHPSSTFAEKVGPFFLKRIVDVIEGRGELGSLTGQ